MAQAEAAGTVSVVILMLYNKRNLPDAGVSPDLCGG